MSEDLPEPDTPVIQVKTPMGIFAFTFCNFILLYFVTKSQYTKERNKFIIKFGTLNSERAAFAKSQSINKQILSNTTSI